MRAHGNGRPPVTVRIEYCGDRDTFGQPLLRLVVGEEYVCLTSGTARRFAIELAAASVALEEVARV